MMNDSSKSMLHSVMVLDLTRVIAGPVCTAMLGDMGAQIIKIENPEGGDDTRFWGPLINGESSYFASLNRNKKGVTMNLKAEEGKAMFLAMAQKADVVVENFRPGVMDKLGLGYKALKRLNPKIIFASISGFGSYGPYRDRQGYDPLSQAMGGIMSLTGDVNGLPTRAGVPVGDMTAGMNMAIGILAALYARATTGQGTYIETSLGDSSAALCTPSLIPCMATGEMPQRVGNRDPMLFPFGDFQAKDGRFMICCGNDKLVEKLFADILGHPEILQDERYKDIVSRSPKERQDELRIFVEEWTNQRSVQENIGILLKAGIPCAPIQNGQQLMADAHIAGVRNMFPQVLHPVIGPMRVMGNPIKFECSDVPMRCPAPLLGQDNEDVYAQLLGFGAEKVRSLNAARVI